MTDHFEDEATPTDRESTPTQPKRLLLNKTPWLQVDDGKWWEDDE